MGLLTFNVSNAGHRMIISFGSKETERIWNGEWVKKIPNQIQETGR
jgi:hypothetical protein